MTLLRELLARIAAQGPITVAEYMEAALGHPEYGYYTRRDPLGAAGDFTTAPEISQIFGEVLGAWIAAQWQACGSPARFALVELGPGRGTLMADMLRATRTVAGFHQAAEIHLIETSPALREKQRALLENSHPRLHWHEALAAVPGLPLLLVANEFFDALPVHQYVKAGEVMVERRIGAQEGVLRWDAPEGTIVEACPAARSIMQEIARRLDAKGGAALIIDYGYAAGEGDTLQAVKHHRYHPVLETPGEADLTVHVDFAALAEAAQKEGARSWGPLPQGVLLSRLGAELRGEKLLQQATESQRGAVISGLQRLISAKDMGLLFKALAVTPPGAAAPEGFGNA